MTFCNKRYIVNNKSYRHGDEGTIIDRRDDQGLTECLMKFADGTSDWFHDHELEEILESK